MQQFKALGGQFGKEADYARKVAPGRLRLATRPISTGSLPILKMIGIVWVAALAASTDVVPPGTTIAATRRRTKSATSAGTLS
jgi:hypothetical protein